MKKFKLHNLTVLDMYVIGSFIMMANYAIVSQLLAALWGIELKTLTVCIFVFFICELLFCATIKVFKIRKQCDKMKYEAATETEEEETVIYHSQVTGEDIITKRPIHKEEDDEEKIKRAG